MLKIKKWQKKKECYKKLSASNNNGEGIFSASENFDKQINKTFDKNI